MSGVNISSEQMEAIVSALEDGQKIEAIKLYREASGEGLKNSKDFIEKLIPELIEKDPDRFSAVNRPLPKVGGCGTAVFACLALVFMGLLIVVLL